MLIVGNHHLLALMKIDPYRITLLLSGYFSAYTQHEHEQYTFNIKKTSFRHLIIC